MIVVDASVWISSLLVLDRNRDETVKWQLTLPNRVHPVRVPGIVLSEVGGAVARREGRDSEGYRAIESILSFPGISVIEMTPTLSLRAAELAILCRLRGADAVYVALAEEFRVPLVSWDREQLTRSRSFIETYSPA